MQTLSTFQQHNVRLNSNKKNQDSECHLLQTPFSKTSKKIQRTKSKFYNSVPTNKLTECGTISKMETKHTKKENKDIKSYLFCTKQHKMCHKYNIFCKRLCFKNARQGFFISNF